MNDEKPVNIPIWGVENTHPDLVAALEEGLSEIVDPELGLTMILTTPYCPYGPSIMESTRKKAESILNMPTKINYGRETWDPTMMEEGLADDWGLF